MGMSMPTTRTGWPRSVRRACELAAVVGELATSWLRPCRFRSGHHGAAALDCVEGLWLLDGRGTAAAIGWDAGSLLGAPARRLLQLMRCAPPLLLGEVSGAAAHLVEAVPAPYREETLAFAAAAGCDGDALLRANAVADACCTALVATPRRGPQGQLALARNLDFFPASALGRNTVLSVLQRRHVLSVASVTWPGFTGVLSGMNQAGLSACVLLNMTQLRHAGQGMPIAYATRHLLEHATSVPEAVAQFARLAVGSSHYLLLADHHTAAVVWHGPSGMQRHDPDDGWLACSNGARSDDGAAIDDRGRHLSRLAAAERRVDESWLRGAIAATLLPGINAQAMLLVPAGLRLQLAWGTARHPAARNPWQEVALGPALAGARLAGCRITALGRPRHQPHYTSAAAAGGRHDGEAQPRPGTVRPPMPTWAGR